MDRREQVLAGGKVEESAVQMKEREKKKGRERLTAAAIQYDARKDLAPRVTAKGKGAVAEKIIELARKNHVPIKNDPALVQILCRLELEEMIPPELYKAIAEILAFVYSVNEQWRNRQKFP